MFFKYFELQKYNLFFSHNSFINITIINKDLIYQKWDPVIGTLIVLEIFYLHL